MFFGWRNGAAVLVVVLSWFVTAALPVTAVSAGETAGLLAGLLVLVLAVFVSVADADDLLLASGRGIRGPTSEERRLRGGFRRHSHPDTAGRPRPRAPGSRPRTPIAARRGPRETVHVLFQPTRHTRRVRPQCPPIVR